MRALKAFIRKWLIVIAAGSFAAPAAAQSIGSAVVVYSPPVAGSTSISPLASPFFTGQWTVNGSLCAAGQVLQGGSPTTCTGGPTLSTGLIIGSGVVDASHQIAIVVTNNGEAGDRLENQSTGTGAFANRVLKVGTTVAYIGASGQNYTGSVGGGTDAKRSWLDTDTTSGAGWDFSAPASNGSHRFYTAGYAAANLRATIDSVGVTIPSGKVYGAATTSGGTQMDNVSTKLLAPDGGAYLIETNGVIGVNTASLDLQASGVSKFSFRQVVNDGQVVITDGGATHGVGVDLTADGVFDLKNRALNAGGTYKGTWGSASESVTRTATSSNIVLASTSSPLQSVVPGANLNVTLPTAATNMHFSIHNGAAFTITVKDAAAATVTTLVNGQTVNVVYDGTSWVIW